MQALADALTAYLKGDRPAARTFPPTVAPSPLPLSPTVTAEKAGGEGPTQAAQPAVASTALEAGGTEMLAQLIAKLDEPPAARRRKLIWACAGLLLAASVLVLAIALWRKGEDRGPGGEMTVVVRLPDFAAHYDGGVKFFLDGKEASREELEGKLKLPVGEHEILVKVNNKAIELHRFKVGAGDAERAIVPELQDPPGDAGEIRSFVGFEHQLAGLAFLPDGRQFAAVDFDFHGSLIRGNFSLWNLANLKPARTLNRPATDQAYRPRSVAVSPNGKHVLIGWQGKGRGYLDYRELPTLKEVWPPRQGHAAWITQISFTPDGRRALSSDDNGVAIVWDLATGQEVDRIVGKVAEFSADGKAVLASDRENAVWLWVTDGATLKRQGQPFKGASRLVNDVAFAPDGTRCAVASADRNVYVFEVVTRKLLYTLKGHKAAVNDVEFSPDGTRLLSCGENVRLWDLQKGEEVRRFEGHAGSVHAVTFSPGGRRALSGGNDRTVRLWQLP
jgi:hypothetical protein